MTKTVKTTCRKQYKRLKQILERLIRPGHSQSVPQLVLQPLKKHPYCKLAAGNGTI
jgi:hypothetical protein